MRLQARSLLIGALLPCLVLQSGCGVMFGYGNPQPVEVFAKLPGGETVPGLAISDRGKILEWKSGEKVFLHPSEEHSISIEDPAYRSSQQKIVKKIRIEIAILDALTLGIGLLVDYLSGSLYSLQPDVTISIRKVEEAERLMREARADSASGTVPSTGVPAGQPQVEGRGVEGRGVEGGAGEGIWVNNLDDPNGARVFLKNDAAKCSTCDGLRGELRTCPHCGAR